MEPEDAINVLGGPLQSCSTDPLTGFSATAIATPAPPIRAATRSARC